MADTYTVTKQSETMRVGPSGTIEPAMHVEIHVTPADVLTTFDVPLGDYTPEHVAGLARDRAATINAIARL